MQRLDTLVLGTGSCSCWMLLNLLGTFLLHLRVCADGQDDTEEAVDDYLDELRDLLGVPTDPHYQPVNDEAPDQQSRQELQRLLQHLHDPVTPGAPYTVLQVCKSADAAQQTTSFALVAS